MPDEVEFSFDVDTDTSEGVGESGSSESTEGLASPFLSNIPEADREVVAKYIKDWDAGVTKRFQEINEKYAPYKEVEPETFQQAVQLYEMATTDPMQLYTALQQWVKDNEMEIEVDDGTDSGVEELDPTAKELKQLKAEMAELKAFREENTRKSEEAEQLAALDKTMQALHTKHGDFDDEAVLLRMRRGMKPEDAVKDYNSWLDEKISSRTKKPSAAYPVLDGKGGSPLGQVDRSKLTDDKVRKALVMEALAANNT